MAEAGESLCASGLNIVSFRPDSATKEERFSKEKKKKICSHHLTPVRMAIIRVTNGNKGRSGLYCR